MRLIPRTPNRALARDLETERLWLRSIGPIRTVRLILPWHKDPELMRISTFASAPLSLWHWFRIFKRPNNVNRFAYAIVPKAERRPVGLIIVTMLGADSANSQIAISDHKWRGRHISIEARAALMSLFFAYGTKVFLGTADSRNAASVFVYKKLGFRLAQMLSGNRFEHPSGRVVDRIRFEITADEWAKRQKAGAALTTDGSSS
jgi:RimJ/RimL family protein N-acetyltransferase